MRDSDTLDPYRAAQARSQVANPYQDVPSQASSPPAPATPPGSASPAGPPVLPSPQRAALNAAINPFSSDRRFRRPQSPQSPVNQSPGEAVPETPAPPPVPQSPEQSAASLWNTGGYSTPGYTAPNVGNVIGGWEAANWNDPSMQTPKYVVGRILAQYPSNTAGLQQAFAEIQRAYPGSTLIGKDSVMIPGVGTIDVGGGFGGTNERWQWVPTLDPNGRPYPQETAGAPTAPTTPATGALSSVLSDPFGYSPSLARNYEGTGGQQNLLTALLAQYLGYF